MFGYKVDGFAELNGKPTVIEINGCFYHKPCPRPNCKYGKHEGFNQADVGTYKWYIKEQKLQQWCDENNGQLIVVWECDIDFSKLRSLATPTIPRVLRKFERKDSDSITKMIEEDNVFGFVTCDLKTPEAVIEKYKTLNFPPIIRRQLIEAEMLSEYMHSRMIERNRSLPVESIINAWNAEHIVVFTPLLKLYLSLGIKIRNVRAVVQYIPSPCFTNFIDKCVQGRIDATNVNETRASTFKVSYCFIFNIIIMRIDVYIMYFIR